MNLTTITVPDGVQSIPARAFYDASNLGIVNLPNSLTSIGQWAFSGCKGLGSITIPDGVQIIEAETFRECINLDTVNLPDGLERIEYGAFVECDGLEGIHLPDSINYLGSSVFNGCDNLISVNYPTGWQEEANGGTSPFAGCENLTTITVPEGVQSIPESAFYDASNLRIVYLPNSLTSIGQWAFSGCTGLGSITIPDGVQIIEAETFKECSNLDTISLPDGLERIEYGAFMECDGLESIHLPDNINYLGSSVFNGCDNLSSVNYPISWQEEANGGTSPFADCEKLDSVFIPEGTISIPDYVFCNASNLTAINMPSSLTSIGDNAFGGCSPNLVLYNVPVGSWIIDIANEYGIQTSPSPMDIVYGAINGRIIDEDNNPVQSVAVFMYPYGSINWSFSTETDADGRWSISNVPTYEQYQIRFYAAEYDFSDRVYQFAATYPSNNVGDIIATLGGCSPARTLSGKVTIASAGDPLSAVNVSIYDSTNTCVSATSTDNEGEWMVGGLIENEDYSVQYSIASYSVNAASHTYKTGSYIEAEASLPSESDSTITFTMKQNGTAVTSIQAGTTVDFAVTAPNAAYIRLVVDGIPYEEHEVVNGTAEFSRLIASARGGIRTIQMQAYSANDGWMGISEAQTLTVSFIDKLNAPTLSFTDSIMKGADLDVSWSSVNHAEKYTVYVFGSDSIQYYPGFNQTEEAATTALNFTVPANAFCSVGKYSIQVVATAEGYDSATGTREVTVVGSTDEEGLLVNSIQIYAENIETNAGNLLLGTPLSDGTSASGTLYAEGDVIHMVVGEKKYVSEVVKPASALNKDVIWYIIRNGVATLDENAQLLTAVARGRTKLIIMARDGSGVKSTYDVEVDYSNTIHDSTNNAYINNGDTLTLSPNMKVNSEYILQIEAKDNWTVSRSGESWFELSAYSGYGNGIRDLKIKLKRLPNTNQVLTSTVTVAFENGSTSAFNVTMNGGKAIYNSQGKNMKYLMKYRDPDGTWHAIQDNETIYLRNNLKAGDKISFSMDCDQIWKSSILSVSDGGARVSFETPQIVSVYAGYYPQQKFDLNVILPPGKGGEWRRVFIIEDSAKHRVGSFTICMQYPDPQFHFTSEDNALISIENGTININPSANRPVRFHVKTASIMNNMIIDPIVFANGSPANWLNVSCENFQHGTYAQGASFDLVFQVKQKPGVGQKYSATIQLHGPVAFLGYGYYGDPSRFVDDIFTVNVTGE